LVTSPSPMYDVVAVLEMGIGQVSVSRSTLLS
jgi:hypothetical protein